MAELDVQPRINSATISQAFELQLRQETDLSLADKKAGGPGEGTNGIGATRGNRQAAQRAQQKFGHDPLATGEFDEEEDSWLIPSPGPASARSRPFDLSPPKGARGPQKKTSTIEAGKRPARMQSNGTSGRAGGSESVEKKMPSPTRTTSKIPRVAQLASSKSASTATAKKAEEISPKKTLKANSQKKFVGLGRKEAGGNSKPEAPANGKRSSASPGSTAGTTKVAAAAGTIDRKRSDPASSRIPSRPSSAASRPGSAAQKGPAAAARPAKTTATRSTKAPGRGGAGKQKAAPIPLLTAVSGPEEELEAAAKAAALPDPEDATEVNGEAAEAKVRASQSGEVAGEEEGTAKAEEAEDAKPVPAVDTEIVVSTSQDVGAPLEDKEQAGQAAESSLPDHSDDLSQDQGRIIRSDDSVETTLARVPDTPFARLQSNANQEDGRPGVGRRHASDLPDQGYSTPTPKQGGCCGCSIM